jgi:hypothetical protein
VTTFNIPIDVQCPSVSYGVNGTQHVFFVGEDLHIHELYSSGANWFINDLTLGSAGNPPLAASDWYLSPITGYWDGSIEHVFYIGSDSDIHELYYNGGWNTSDIVASGPGARPPPSTSP